MSLDDYLVHLSDLPTDVEKQEIIDFFKENGLEGVTVNVLKKHYKIPTQWAKVAMASSENYNKAIQTLRYPKVKHDIESRLMENITDGSLKSVNDTNVVVKGLDKDKVDCAALDKFFTEKIAKIKSCKVSKTIEGEGSSVTSRSNGYGFVNFSSKEDADKAIAELNGTELEGSKLLIERYNKDIKREAKFNNLYVRGFDESFDEASLVKMFTPFGELGSVTIMKDEEGKSKKFGFVCFKEAEPASNAVETLHEKPMEDGTILYVAKFEKKQNRWQALKKSLARSNLYVRNFDKNVSEDDLKQFFGGDAVVRNVRIMTTEVTREGDVAKESKQFGFVSFNKPSDAAEIVLKYNNEELEFNNKQLYVNYYEDKTARKKRLASKKEKPEGLFGMLDGSMAAGGDQNNMMEYFMQMFQQYFKSYSAGGNNQGYGGNGGYQQNYGGNQYQGNYNGQRRGRGGRGYPQGSSYGSYQNPQQMYNRAPPRNDTHQSYAGAQNMMPAAGVPPTVGVPPTGGVPPTAQGAPMMSQPPQATPPVSNPATIYLNTMKGIFGNPEYATAEEEGKREKIGEEIYNHVLEKAGDEAAPKITGMIIDLPFDDLISSIQSYEGLQEKIQEGMDLLTDDQ
jgi:polyadenylate-binding protein